MYGSFDRSVEEEVLAIIADSPLAGLENWPSPTAEAIASGRAGTILHADPDAVDIDCDEDPNSQAA